MVKGCRSKARGEPRARSLLMVMAMGTATKEVAAKAARVADMVPRVKVSGVRSLVGALGRTGATYVR